MNMNVKRTYAPPQVEAVELTLGGTLLTGSQQQAQISDPTPVFPLFDWE